MLAKIYRTDIEVMNKTKVARFIEGNFSISIFPRKSNWYIQPLKVLEQKKRRKEWNKLYVAKSTHVNYLRALKLHFRVSKILK